MRREQNNRGSSCVRACVVERADAAPPLGGRIKGTPWEQAHALRIARYPWFVRGEKQGTTVRLLYDRQAIYLQFRCRDRHISSRTTALNGPVCDDSCVEFFATPNPVAGQDYLNIEVNCCGVMHVGFGPDRYSRRLISKSLAGSITVVTSEAGPTRRESSDDSAWWAAVRLPFDLVEKMSRASVRPRSGSAWLANFYRCGGRTDPQYASWNHVSSSEPDFHRPECFGLLRFA